MTRPRALPICAGMRAEAQPAVERLSTDPLSDVTCMFACDRARPLRAVLPIRLRSGVHLREGALRRRGPGPLLLYPEGGGGLCQGRLCQICAPDSWESCVPPVPRGPRARGRRLAGLASSRVRRRPRVAGAGADGRAGRLVPQCWSRRCDEVDAPALRAALEQGTVYVGALGSRQTQTRRTGWLTEYGAGPDQLAASTDPPVSSWAPPPGGECAGHPGRARRDRSRSGRGRLDQGPGGAGPSGRGAGRGVLAYGSAHQPRPPNHSR